MIDGVRVLFEYTHYKVMLDGASYSALVERYEVTDTEGEILIVREKR